MSKINGTAKAATKGQVLVVKPSHGKVEEKETPTMHVVKEETAHEPLPLSPLEIALAKTERMGELRSLREQTMNTQEKLNHFQADLTESTVTLTITDGAFTFRTSNAEHISHFLNGFKNLVADKRSGFESELTALAA